MFLKFLFIFFFTLDIFKCGTEFKARYIYWFVMYYIRSTVRHAIHLQFDVSAKALEIKSVTKTKVSSLMYY
jgi:hypothetical protein